MAEENNSAANSDTGFTEFEELVQELKTNPELKIKTAKYELDYRLAKENESNQPGSKDPNRLFQIKSS